MNMQNLRRFCYPRPNLDLFKKHIDEIYQSGIYTQGAICSGFEEEIKSISGDEDVCLTANGTISLSIALLALGIKPGDIVLTTSYSFCATASSIYTIGAVPVFVDHSDVNIRDTDIVRFIEHGCYQTTDGLRVKENILVNYYHRNLRTDSVIRGIIVVDQFGIPLEIEGIEELAEKYSLSLVRDAACALGSIKNGKSCISSGTYSKSLSSVSFHPRKIITTGEGGALSGRKELIDICRSLTNHGEGDIFVGPSGNARMGEINAALGLAALDKLDEIVKKRNRILDIILDQLPHSTCCPATQILSQDDLWNVQSLPIVMRDRERACEIVEGLKKSGISVKTSIVPINKLKSYEKYTCIDTPLSSSLAERCILVPCHEEMDDSEIEALAKTLSIL